MATIQDSWRQIDGGMRYAVRVGRYTVTVDTERGQYTGFVRLSNEQLSEQAEARLLKKAIAAVRRLYETVDAGPMAP